MPPLKDNAIRSRICESLSHSESGDHVRFTRQAESGLRETIPNTTPRGLVIALRTWTQKGGEINQVPETREPYCRQHKFHYDFVLSIGGNRVYVESVLDESRSDFPELVIVNIHLAD